MTKKTTTSNAQPKVLVATTCIGDFEKHLESLLENRKKIDYSNFSIFISRPDLPPFPQTPGEIINCAGRDLSVQEAKKQKTDWILFLDADIRVDRDIIKRFLKYNYPFLAGCISARDDPNYCIGHIWENRNSNKATWLTREMLREPIFVDSMGGGLMMVHKKVFNKLDLSKYKGPQNYRPLNYMGADMFFAEQSHKKTGFKPMMIPEITAWHLWQNQKCRLWGKQKFSDREIL